MKQDIRTVNTDGKSIVNLPHGVTMRDLETHIDDRGSLFEVYNPLWNWHKTPIVFGHVFTIRPGVTKGWGVHKKHTDRYCIMFGELEVILYDGRAKSPTKGLVSKIYMTEYNRKLLSIPPGVWHANRNIGKSDVAVLDMPTEQYDPKNPDKYRLPLNTKKIPFKFENPKGW